MSIHVSRTEHANCESQVQAHDDVAAEAELSLSIGSNEPVNLCIDCARKVFNVVGFMVMSATGESIEQLVGLKKKRTKP